MSYLALLRWRILVTNHIKSLIHEEDSGNLAQSFNSIDQERGAHERNEYCQQQRPLRIKFLLCSCYSIVVTNQLDAERFVHSFFVMIVN